MRTNDTFTYFNMSILCISFNTLFLCLWLQVINRVKFIHQSEGHIKIKVKYLHPFKFYVAHTFCKQVVCIQLNAFLFYLHVSFSSQEGVSNNISSAWSHVPSGGLSQESLCLGGSLSAGGLCQGVFVWPNWNQKSGRYVSYWNAF